MLKPNEILVLMEARRSLQGGDEFQRGLAERLAGLIEAHITPEYRELIDLGQQDISDGDHYRGSPPGRQARVEELRRVVAGQNGAACQPDSYEE